MSVSKSAARIRGALNHTKWSAFFRPLIVKASGYPEFNF